jgi:hypothetical protein
MIPQTVLEKQHTKEFWDWFIQHHPDVEHAYTVSDAGWLESNLTPRLQRIQSELVWELGPYHDPDYTLVISPAVRESLSLTERIIAAAPDIPKWRFLPAKPPKELTSLVMELPDIKNSGVCADKWLYRLTQYNDREFFDIEVFTDAPPTIKDDHLEVLTHRLIESLVGEEIYLDRIGAITIYRPADPRSRERTTKLPFLYKHMCELIGKPY